MQYLHLNSWAGHTVHPVKVIKEMGLKFRVELLEDCIRGPAGKLLTVPWYAISDDDATETLAALDNAGDTTKGV